MIKRLLIANRGEIALRIIRCCRELGIEAVAVYSDIDVRSPHVAAADRAVRIGPAPAGDSYLSIPRLLDAARETGADTLHPGYGFLAESTALASACEQAGLTFVGPPAAVMARMGSKIEARAMAEAAGLPIVPGRAPDDQTDRGIGRAVADIGYPVLIKPSAGGGGKGMHLVRGDRELEPAIQAARREALAAFANGTLYVEQLLDRPRHIEIQILGDRHGGFVHLYERECTIQRRHQKIIEESPSTAVDPPLRARMCQAALDLARAVSYQNAGTVEFLVEGAGNAARFYFLEMNTRLQVEHPVTEAVTGLDLVRAQLAIASGESLPWTQDSISQRGHAIECRVYAEDPAEFLPQAGRILLYREPAGAGIRVDSGVIEGSEVPLYYDPLLAKLLVVAEDRDAAVARGIAALRSYAVLGIRTNISFLRRVLEHSKFRSGDIDTRFVEREHANLHGAGNGVPLTALAAAAVAEESIAPQNALQTSAMHTPTMPDPWSILTGWRG